MVKRYRRKKKNTRRRRRTYRRRSLTVRPDGIVKEKVVISHPLYADTSSSGFLNIHWFKRNISGANLFHNVGVDAPSNTANTQFADMARNYKYYKVYGLSIKFMPIQFGQSQANQASLQRIHIASDFGQGLLSPDDADMMNAKDFRAYPAQKA